jgi:uncharacterized membrane protein YidH (DUF202 family)
MRASMAVGSRWLWQAIIFGSIGGAFGAYVMPYIPPRELTLPGWAHALMGAVAGVALTLIGAFLNRVEATPAHQRGPVGTMFHERPLKTGIMYVIAFISILLIAGLALSWYTAMDAFNHEPSVTSFQLEVEATSAFVIAILTLALVVKEM